MKCFGNEVHHLLYQLPDFPLSLTAQTLVAHVNEFSQITGEVERGFTGIGENIYLRLYAITKPPY